MQNRVGFEMKRQCPGPTPMTPALCIQDSRSSDLVRSGHRVTRPAAPITAYRDLVGNGWNRLVATPGGCVPSAAAPLNDTGYAFDARNNRPRIERVLVARARGCDACDLTLAGAVGLNTPARCKVWTDEVAGP